MPLTVSNCKGAVHRLVLFEYCIENRRSLSTLKSLDCIEDCIGSHTLAELCMTSMAIPALHQRLFYLAHFGRAVHDYFARIPCRFQCQRLEQGLCVDVPAPEDFGGGVYGKYVIC